MNNAFFKIFREKDSVSVEEVYTRCGERAHRRKFIENKLTGWKKKGLVEPVYGTQAHEFGRRILTGLRLTPRGALYFDRTASRAAGMLTIEEMLRIVLAFQKAHPELDITFELRQRDHKQTDSTAPDERQD